MISLFFTFAATLYFYYGDGISPEWHDGVQRALLALDVQLAIIIAAVIL